MRTSFNWSIVYGRINNAVEHIELLVEQLSGLDAAFVHQDSRRTPMHMSVVLIYDAGEDDDLAISIEPLKQLITERLADFPLFHRKLQRVPMGMDTPYWVDIQKPRWDNHIHESTLPETAGWRELHARLSRLHGTGMDLSQPLWEMHLIHGMQDLPELPANCQALLLKIHHSALDGVSMAAIVYALHQKSEIITSIERKLMQAPSSFDVWTRANFNNINRQFKFIETARNVLPRLFRQQSDDDMPAIHTSGSRFNVAVQANRSTGSIIVPKSDILAIKRAVRRVTLNDIALACVSGALREYLLFHNQLPDESLAAGVPVNLRSPAQEQSEGNRIVTMVVGLATDIADPVERVRLIHQFAVKGKKQITQLGAESVMDISDSLAPGILAGGIKTIAWASQTTSLPTPFHTMVSNVPGPIREISLGGAKLVVPVGFGPIRDNMGLFHVVSNSHKLISISFNACSRVLPDPEYYQQCLRNAYAELLEQATVKN